MTEQDERLLAHLRWLNCLQEIFEALPDENTTVRQLLEQDPNKLRQILARHYGEHRADQMMHQVSC